VAGPPGPVGPSGPSGPAGSGAGIPLLASLNTGNINLDYINPTGGAGTLATTDSGAAYGPQSPIACTVQNLRVYLVSDGTASTMTVTLFQNGSASSLTCNNSVTSTAGNTATCTDLVHTVSIAVGDNFVWQVQNSSASTVSVAISAVCK
jgi:hypothetical protein